MGGIKYFPEDLDIRDKKIILRLDLNVPLKNNKIEDDSRIKSVIPFLKLLIKKKAKIIIISHLGRPKGQKNSNLSLMPVFKHIKKNIKTNIFFFTGELKGDLFNKTSYLKAGEILLIENIRFFKGEEENSEKFARQLASLGEIYVNDAFSCSHRLQASIHQITKFSKKNYGGPLLKKEIEAINLVVKGKKKPITCIIGGSKISTKINIILNLIKKTNKIVIVGAMANNFLAIQGHEVGKSLIENNVDEIINQIFSESKKHNCEIIIPEDCATAQNFNGERMEKKKDKISKDEIILDIGPGTIEKIRNIIDQSNTVMWNGPAGYFENKNFALGTNFIATKISENTKNKSLLSIIGGGDTVSAINKLKKKLLFTHLSTAGGAFLEYLEEKDLPGLSVLK